MTEVLQPDPEKEIGDTAEMAGRINDEEFKKRFQALDGARHAFKEKAAKEREERLKIAEELKVTKEKLATLAGTAEKSVQPPAPADLPIREVLKLRSEGFSEKRILELVDEAQSLGIPVEKLLSNPTFKAGIETREAKARSEQNTPSPSFGGFTTSQGKTWDKMTDAERATNFPDYIKSLAGNKSSE